MNFGNRRKDVAFGMCHDTLTKGLEFLYFFYASFDSFAYNAFLDVPS